MAKSSLPAVGTEPNDGSPREGGHVIAATAFMLALVLLLTVIDRMRE
ncbi:MAG TPA: hypothetical protein VKB25_14420 [Conexibacter sp.]|nr:hypothetical protein [Conexibacter sp.]